jgi:hypothetical protein
MNLHEHSFFLRNLHEQSSVDKDNVLLYEGTGIRTSNTPLIHLKK